MLVIDLIQLKEFAGLMNDEVGEYVLYLSRLYSRTECMSDEFRAALDIEAYRYLEWFKDNYEITEVEVVPTPYNDYLLVEKE